MFRARDITLHSLYDPHAEARQWAGMLPDTARPCVVLGFGNGYHLEGLQARPVLVVEPDLGLLRRALDVRDLTAVLSQVELLCPATAQQAVDQLAQHLTTQDFTLLVHQPSLRLHPALFKELTDRLEARKRLMEFRLKILVVYPIYGGSLPIAQYCSRALQTLGHEVDIFDSSRWYDMYQFMQGVTDQDTHVRQLQGMVVNVLAEAIVARALQWEPDLLFALAQAPLAESALGRLRKFDVPTAFWFVEDFRTMDYWQRLGPLYDHVFCIQQGEFLRQLKERGCSSVHYLPLACDPAVHKLLSLAAEERQEYASDVSFVGAGYYNRRNFFEGLLDFNLKIWGSDWEGCIPLKSVLQRGGARLSTEESVKIFNASPINMNLHSSSYHEGVNPHGDYVNPRTFELAACGAFQLVDHRALLPDLFRVGEEVVCFSTLHEARQLIPYYLSHRAERETIAAQARARALKDHTYEQRMRDMLEIVFQRHHSRLVERRSAENTAQHLLTKAGDDEELQQLLGKFQPQARVSLDTLAGQVRTGQGALSDAELTFLFLQEFKKNLKPIP
ncbi:MAG: glycosyltransferase [Nitrospinae bacterium]|nr:glycosyltransferase [Nitrospinota bacterium]